ncbi:MULTISPECIES: gamma-glutamyltransferase [unclassified Peribacillus]|uniref:gamma-glutamyltransferase n=1 Tax=unclassified Peribacillus TaxID=2675266 RepID=UPI003671B220
MTQSIIGTKIKVESPFASMAGIKILEKGGTFNSAVAVSACLDVVYPHMTGLGGDTFWLIYEKKDGKLVLIMEADAPEEMSILKHIEGKRRSLFAGEEAHLQFLGW